MAERPILFSGPMVRAILDGRKMQTRRIVKPQPELQGGLWFWAPRGGLRLAGYSPDSRLTWPGDKVHPQAPLRYCPYGQPGDRLWVRETWQAASVPALGPDDCIYRADDNRGIEDLGEGRWRPSIHMPRWASRITLEVTGVRVERLQQISEADARAEGARFHDGRGVGHSGWRHDDKDVHADARSSFARLWTEINGAESWKADPWAWVVEFSVAEVSRG